MAGLSSPQDSVRVADEDKAMSFPAEDTDVAAPEDSLEAGQNNKTWTISCSQLGAHYGIRYCHVYYLLVFMAQSTFAASFIGTVPFVQKNIIEEFEEYGVTSVSASLISTSVALGSMLGVPLGGWLADRQGRRMCALAGSVIVPVANLAHLAVPTGHSGFAWLVCLRWFLGIFYGALLVNENIYAIELFADNFRGAAMCLISAGWCAGQVFADKFMAMQTGLPWRTAISYAPLISWTISFLGMSFMPESPRWLVITGRSQRGQKTLKHIFASKVLYGDACVGEPPLVTLPPGCEHGVKVSVKEALSQLFHPSLRRSTLTVTGLYVAISGNLNAIWIYGPAIVKKVLHAGDDIELFVVSDLFAAAASLVGFVVIEPIGRRSLMMLTATAKVVCFLLLLRPSIDKGGVQCIWIVSSFATSIMWSAFHTYGCEIFPTTIRGIGTAFSCVFGRVSSIVAPPIFGAILQHHDIPGAVAFAAGGFGIVFLLAYSIQKDTGGQKLLDTVGVADKEQ